MIDFPITDLFDDSLCLTWLERHLYPDDFVCPQCGDHLKVGADRLWMIVSCPQLSSRR